MIVNHTPLVSVIMPVYNAKLYLAEAVGSVLSQTFSDFELLILDDGSEDHSLDIAKSFFDARIRVLAGSRRGLVAIRNAGLAEARGEYIAWMDADDVSHPDRLRKQVAFMQSHPHVVMVGTWARLIEGDGQLAGVSAMLPTTGRPLHVALCASNQFINGSTMMRRTALHAVGAYRPQFTVAEDYDLALRLSEIGYLANLAEPLYMLRRHATSTTATIGSRVLATYTARARECALQRYLTGRDYLGYKAPCEAAGSLPPVTGMGSVARSDWAQIVLWQGRLRLCFRIICSPLGKRRRVFAASLVFPGSLSRAYLRGVLDAFRRGTWTQLGRAKVQRVSRRMMESLNA